MGEHDLHPEYLSTKYAQDQAGVDLVGVQHHHAHIASCLADNGESGPVIGVAFDGTGFGPDGTIWGGEFLLADFEDYRRLGHPVAVPMPGGAAAIRQPWRMAVSYLDSAGSGWDAAVLRRHGEWPTIAAMARRGVNAPLTSSLVATSTRWPHCWGSATRSPPRARRRSSWNSTPILTSATGIRSRSPTGRR